VSRARKLGITAAIVGVLAAILFLMLRPVSWQSLAIRSEEAIFEAKGERLRGHFHPEELRALGISEDLAVKAINEVVAPSLEGIEPDRSSRKFSEVGNKYGMSFVVSQGAAEPFTAHTWITVTEKGYRVQLGDVIAASRRIIKNSVGKDNDSTWQRKLMEQSKQLRAIGIKGNWEISSNEVEPWTEYSVSAE
jgi:hypothetical protein